MFNELSARIWQNQNFHKDYATLNRSNLLISLGVHSDSFSVDVGRRLLQCATHFAYSNEPKFREAAYRIAIGALAVYRGSQNGNGKISELTLSRLGNFPAIDFLTNLDASLKEEKLPLNLWFEKESHREKNTKRLGLKAELHLTEFQVNLWEALHDHNAVVVTAPTSAGKSFALQNFLCEAFLNESPRICVYLVPTRALITQVAESVKTILTTLTLSNVEVSTIPSSPDELGGNEVFYVLTQERLQMLLDKVQLSIASMVVDEAQVLADDARGVVLQTVVERVRDSNPDSRIFFGSPTTANPEVYPLVFGILHAKQLQTNESPVTQNLIFIDTDPHKSGKVTARAKVNGNILDLGSIEVGTSLNNQKQILPKLARFFGKTQQNLIYASSPAPCEGVATILVDLSKEPTESENGTDSENVLIERNDFAKFLRDQFHRQYFLAEAVIAGVAFHYGSMPASIRKSVEKLFSNGHLNFLVCTSTLLHGVNLPAKNIFLHNPTKGRDGIGQANVPITSVEFWNLGGRAGRLKKDFEGNVFLIDERMWQERPYEGNSRQSVRPSLQVNLLERTESLFEFMRNYDHPSGQRQGIENTFVKLFNDFRSNKLEQTLSRFPGNLPSDVKRNLLETLGDISSRIKVPKEICEQNINVSVLRQQEMLDYLIERIRKYGPERVLPIHPSRYYKEVYQNVLQIFRRIHNCFEKKPPSNRSHFYFALIGSHWMRGDSYAKLIENAYDAAKKKRQKGEPRISTVIRGVFDNVENDLRFRYVKFTKCYIDLLTHALVECSHADYIPSIPSLPLFLELGACSDTMISLIGAGISRTSAGILKEYAPRDNMNRPEVLRLLRETNWETRDIPRITIHETDDILNSNGH